MISVPHTYSEWIELLDMFQDRTNDDEVLAAMQAGTIEWSPGVADRFSEHYMDAVYNRIDAAVKKFDRNSICSDWRKGDIVQALHALKKEWDFLVQVVDIPVFPREYREQYVQIVIDEGSQIQTFLEKLAKERRDEELSYIVRKYKII